MDSTPTNGISTDMPDTEEEIRPSTIETETEAMAAWFAKMKQDYRLQESTLMDIFRIQLMWMEQSDRATAQAPTGQDAIDAIAREAAEANPAVDEVITADE